MEENQLGKSIMRYRKERGLSQEKVAEFMGISRQAVTKWENGVSKPSSDNLIKLAELFEISVGALLGYEEREEAPIEPNITVGKLPWIFIGISAACIVGYLISSTVLDSFNIGTLVCMFVLCVPIQLFLHVYFSHAVSNDSFHGIAGFDDRTEYNLCEVKKMLVQINLRLGIMSTVCVFLLWVVSCIGRGLGWLNGVLLAVYMVNFVATVGVINYQMADKIYCRDEDKKRAKHGIPITVGCILLLFAGIGVAALLFEMR